MYQLVQDLYEQERIQSDSVFQAMCQVDRGDYSKVNPYLDRPQGVAYNATISAPHMHAMALEYLKDHLKVAKKTLDIGSGTGYLTVAFYKMFENPNAISYGIEHIPELVKLSIDNINKKESKSLKDRKIQIYEGDGRLGLSQFGPYDCIHVGASIGKIPQQLLDQLANGGRMVIPVGPRDDGQEYMLVNKDQNGNITKNTLFAVRFTPLTSKLEQCGGQYNLL